MDISLTTKGIGRDDLSWLGSAHATNNAQTITLDLTSGFADADFYGKGFIPSGVPVIKLDSGLYGLYTEESGKPLAGFILTAQDNPGTTATRVSAPLLDHGRIKVGNLPVELPEAAQTSNTHFIYVKEG